MIQYDWGKVKRETLEAVVMALHTSHAAEIMRDSFLMQKLELARAQSKPPPLRTRAEVDAEIVRVVRSGYVDSRLMRRLTELSGEPLAPDPTPERVQMAEAQSTTTS